MNSDIPRDVVMLLTDAETVLSEILQYENVSTRARELGEEILRGFRLVRNRHHFDVQHRGGDTNVAATGQDTYDDNHSLSHGTSLASDEVSLTSDYVDDESEDAGEPEKLLKQGYLEKRNKDHGLFGSEWRKKWCVLTNMSFCYYSSEKGKVPKGGFLIKNCSSKLVPYIRKDSRRDSCFELVSPGSRSYQFTAASPAEARDWVDQIQFLVKDILSASIPCEDDEESYDDVESLNSSSMGQRISLDRADSPMEDDDDIYEVVPGDEEEDYDLNLEGGSIINYADYYQGLWDCTSDKSDELSFQRGDIIRILSKEYNAYGWWVGELHGMIGIVPRDYLQSAYEMRNI
ncbi:src kinase-associated phosphoprotein 1 [Rana temporaria]|uniref:src kinase-associated phosphoprotein 1 n=1 Tax=Rana temporaria TaxID=8407 RepID=UPI001AAD6630|nr:src kinase-associated phosphoprotein 1 [Rana temporaria]